MEKNQLKGKLRHGTITPASTLHTTELSGEIPSGMVNNSAYYALLLERKATLAYANEQLKSTFIGLDRIIDELMGLVSSWYLFPEAQLRPMVVNLWGLTGSGKTALVKQLVELLDFRKRYIQVDMGEFESDSATWFRKTLTGDMEYLNEQPCILCLDEFQFARTLDNQGNELGKDKLRFVWDLIDSGKLTYTPPTNAFYQKRAEECLTLLLHAQLAGVVISKGIVVEKTEEFLRIFQDFYFESYGRGGKPMDVNYFHSEDFTSGVYYLAHDDVTFEDSVKADVAKADLEGIMTVLLRSLETRNATRELDLSKSLIFVLGNLDEAYDMSRSMNPDVSADELHEATLRISITNIKSALRKRFRPEQIARLGNNHLIYRAFCNADFQELIRRELQRVAAFIETEFGFTIVYNESIHRLIYQEGVFPAQGTRPVLTTIKNYIEAWFGRIVLRIIEEQLEVATMEWSYAGSSYRFVFKNSEGAVVAMHEEALQLKIEPLRKTSRELQAHTAVHEAGHAVLAVLTLRILPSVIVSKSAADYAEGFCMINLPEGMTTRETLRKDIIISLGGFVAERLIFGEEHTSSGVNGDIEEASRLANVAIRQYAMGSDPILLEAASSNSMEAFTIRDKHRDEAMQLIRTCEAEALCLLERNKLLLLKIAEYLTDHYKMEEAMIADFVLKYGKEAWIRTEGFVKKEQYFAFEQIIREQLQALEKEQINP